MSLALIAFLVANSQCKTLAGSPKILLGFLGDFSIGSFLLLLLLLLLLLFNILFFFQKIDASLIAYFQSGFRPS